MEFIGNVKQPGPDFVLNGVKLLVALIEAKEGYDPSRDYEFSNDEFSIRPYCWCNGEGEHAGFGCPPNFKCGKFEAEWYKHIDRGFDHDEISSDEFRRLMIKCLNSI